MIQYITRNVSAVQILNQMVKNTMFKLIALDIDGTLKVSGGTISNYTKSILSKCKDAGTIVVIATGRSRKSADPIVNELSLIHI